MRTILSMCAHFGQIFPKFLAKMGPLVSQELSPLTAAIQKESWKILIVAEFIRRCVKDTLKKKRIKIWPLMWLFGS